MYLLPTSTITITAMTPTKVESSTPPPPVCFSPLSSRIDLASGLKSQQSNSQAFEFDSRIRSRSHSRTCASHSNSISLSNSRTLGSFMAI
ncbi:hypothetical protein L1887_23398 [Cichorium endivia]|nr:hypothetical protein L1887_23398 [Cichorium endivia]